MTKEEFDEWKMHPVTQMLLKGTLNRYINEIKDGRVMVAGLEPLEDRFYAGMAVAYATIRDVSLDDMEIDTNA